MLIVVRLILVVATIAALAGPVCVAQPRVVTSIAPVHSLVSNVMRGMGEPFLIISGNRTPHTFRLAPSLAAELQQADLVIWVSSTFETFLPRVLQGVDSKAQTISLVDLPGMHLLNNRPTGLVNSGDAESIPLDSVSVELHNHGEPVDRSIVDPHIWLDPRNAARIVESAVIALSSIDPEKSSRYKENGRATLVKLEELNRFLEARLKHFAGKDYVVVHDAYQYFETRFGLSPMGSVTLSSAHTPSLMGLQELRSHMRAHTVGCVFNEAKFSPRLAETLVEGLQVRVVTVDPLGSTLAPGPDAYFSMMRQLAESFVACLTDP